jgi:hypothetical protein
MLIAFSVRAVRPVVSMNVRWREISSLTSGTVVLYLTFLAKVSYEMCSI